MQIICGTFRCVELWVFQKYLSYKMLGSLIGEGNQNNLQIPVID
jgi:hypothetical protein